MSLAGVRKPAVAGTFYPADGDSLRAQVETYLVNARPGRAGASGPKAIVAPHAGYEFSGPVAASAYACVRARRDEIRRVVLLGPAHRFPLSTLAAPAADFWATPLGLVRIASTLRDDLVDAGQVIVSDEAHADEHSLEVHLPFLQVVLGDVSVLPLVVGRTSASAVADALDAVWDGDETLIVVSTDLSHYHDRTTATELDRRTAAAIVARQPEAIGPGDVCGLFPLRGMLEAARRHALDVELLDLRTSADTAGTPVGVVGYGAFALA